MTAHTSVLVRFCQFRLDLTSGELWNGSQRVLLADQPLRILTILIERPGTLVTREELRRGVWADDTFVDFEHGLNAAVKRLREILGDSAAAPRFIETIPRHGYRFIAVIDEDVTSAADEAVREDQPNRVVLPAPLPSRSARIGARSRLVWATAAAAVLTLVAVVVAMRWSRATSVSESDSNSMSQGRLVRLTTSSGLSSDPALSADGSLLAYASDRAGTSSFDIWVQPIAGGSPIRITTDPGDEIEPSFSPDGTSIVFSKSETGGVYVVAALGGEPRQLVAARRVHTPRFSPDGRWVVYWTGQTVWTAGLGSRMPNVISAIHVVPSGGGVPQALAQGFISARYAIWSPDGHRILFLGERATAGSPTIDWYVVHPNGDGLTRTGAVDAIAKAGVTGVPIPAAWTTNGDVVFTTATEDHANIWRLPLAPEAARVSDVPRRLTFGTAIERSPVVSSSGRLAFDSIVENVDVWRVPLDVKTGIASGALERVTVDAANDRLENVSADGRVVAFTSSRTNPEQVWLKDMQTGRERQLTHLETRSSGAQVSPDGSRVAVNAEVAGRSRVDLYPSTGGQRSTLCEDCRVGGWSSDGSRILIGRGTWRFVLEIASSREVPLAEHPNWHLNRPRFSRDGQWVVFHTPDAPDLRQIYAVPASLDAAVPADKWVAVVTDFGIQPNWSADATGVYHFSQRDGHFCAWLQPVDATSKRPIGEPRAVLHLHEPRLRAAVRAMPTNDVQGGYLYMTLTEASSNIWMLDTQRDALGTLAPDRRFDRH
jgi:Tol biopolymer transport system component/DNA-binding winged helix-turn-helix (wHTH) protein